MKKKFLALAATVMLSVISITAYADTSYYNETAVATTDVNPAVYELNYTEVEIAYLNTWKSTYTQSYETFLINNQKEKKVPTDYLIDERCILQGVGIDMGSLTVTGLEASKVYMEIMYTWNMLQEGTETANSAQFYDIISPLTRYSNNVIVTQLSERPYYNKIVEIRYDMNDNYVTYRVKENPNAVSAVTVAITKFPSEDYAYTAKELSVLAETRAIADEGAWIGVYGDGRAFVAAADGFNTSDPDYADNVLFAANTLVMKRYGCDLTGYNYKNFYLVDTWTESGMTVHSVRTALIPGKEFIVYLDSSLKCVTMRARDI